MGRYIHIMVKKMIYEKKFKDILFFADAPLDYYPYRLRTYDKYMDKETKPYDYLIIDLGVYTYLVKNKEHRYPEKLERGMFCLSFELTEKEYVAVPDYPPINFEFNKKIDYNNIELTIKNWLKFKEAKTKNCIFTIQFSEIMNHSIIKDEINMYPEPPSKFLGLGGLCRIMGSLKEKEYMNYVMREIKRSFPNHFIHVWGASIWHLNSMRKIGINSFDSAKWSRPVTRKLPNRSAKTKKESIQFFNAYIERIYNIEKNTKLSDFLR